MVNSFTMEANTNRTVLYLRTKSANALKILLALKGVAFAKYCSEMAKYSANISGQLAFALYWPAMKNLQRALKRDKSFMPSPFMGRVIADKGSN